MEAVFKGGWLSWKELKLKEFLHEFYTHSSTKFLYQTEMQMTKNKCFDIMEFYVKFYWTLVSYRMGYFPNQTLIQFPCKCGYFADIIRGYESPCICSQVNMIQKYEILYFEIHIHDLSFKVIHFLKTILRFENVN